jgi:hypothetical protein
MMDPIGDFEDIDLQMPVSGLLRPSSLRAGGPYGVKTITCTTTTPTVTCSLTLMACCSTMGTQCNSINSPCPG